MKKGEKYLLTVKPQYAFADNGREPVSGNDCVVPSNATIQITLELVSWKIVSEVTTDNKVSKKILNEGEEYDCPNDGSDKPWIKSALMEMGLDATDHHSGS
ncbi:FKBP-type peptidyl-prolyl cis-trans isomerase domain-containing protein [Tanacetum coccineum]